MKVNEFICPPNESKPPVRMTDIVCAIRQLRHIYILQTYKYIFRREVGGVVHTVLRLGPSKERPKQASESGTKSCVLFVLIGCPLAVGITHGHAALQYDDRNMRVTDNVSIKNIYLPAAARVCENKIAGRADCVGRQTEVGPKGTAPYHTRVE